MTATVRIEVGTRYTAWCYGSPYPIRQALIAAQCPRQYDVKFQAVSIPKNRLDDVLAALETQHVDVELVHLGEVVADDGS